MRLYNYINELSVAKKPDIQRHENDYEIAYDIRLENGEYFSLKIFKEDTDAWSLDYWFELKVKPQFDKRLVKWDIVFQDVKGSEAQNPKMQGTSVQLFAAMQSVLEKEIKKSKPPLIKFALSDYSKSREKLYDTLGRLISRKGNYLFKRKGTSQYWFIRKDILK